MLLYLLLLFITVPLVELLVILRVNEVIGWRWSVAIIICTGVLGSYLARRQGRAIVARIRTELNEHRLPQDKIVEGLLLLVGGIMLLFPGYLSDAAGFMLMIPGNRRILREFLKSRMRARIQWRNRDQL